MKYIIWFLPLLLLSCAKEKHKSRVLFESAAIPVTNITTGTVSFTLEKKDRPLDRILIESVKKEVDAKGDSTAFFKINFFRGKKLLSCFPVKIDFGRKAGDWYFFEQGMTNHASGKSDGRFMVLSNGVAACGYGQDEFLFFVNGDKVELFSKDLSVGDADVYSYGTNYTPEFSGKIANVIVAHTVEDEELELTADSIPMTKIQYSDSIRYEFDGRFWKKNVISKGVYRTEVKKSRLDN